MILTEKSKMWTPLQTLPKNVDNLGKIKKVAQSGKNRPIWSHCM